MAGEQNFEVNYTINVKATEGVQQLQSFVDCVKALDSFRNGLGSAVNNVNSVMTGLDKIFPAKNGKQERSYSFVLNTNDSETRLKTIQEQLDAIIQKAANVKLNINPGKIADGASLKKGVVPSQPGAAKAVGTVEDVTQTQKTLTKAIGKINAALTHFKEPRELNIDTKAAQRRLKGVLATLKNIRAESKGIKLGIIGSSMAATAPATAERVFRLPHNVRFIPHVQGVSKPSQKEPVVSSPKQTIPSEAITSIRAMAKVERSRDLMLGHRQRAAINRLQYSQPMSIRNLMPFAYMLNGYMLYGMMRSEVTKAVEYANILESAHSILKVADDDLSTFDKRFDAMARNVREVGVQTKFTAVEVAGAVKYLSMAGQDIKTINQSIRPIANLALIGDNDISQIADLTTNIMAGYNIKAESMNSVADIIASTISRSNVNVIETAESFKMAAGFLQNVGVTFSEAAAAVGILGNAGIKGTMAGTTLRAMATRFAAPPREAQKVLDRLGVDLFRYEVIYGKRIEKLKSLADIFEEMFKKGATTHDMSKLFGRYGGSGATMFLNNYEKLRELTAKNRISHGISEELAEVKQNTTKGLWFQMTSQLSETFMKAYEIMEPKLRSVLKGFIELFKTDKFARGLASLAGIILDIFQVLAKIGSWFGKNFYWLQPIIFTGLVATRIFKLSGAIINLGVALGMLGKQSAAASGLQMLTSLSGLGGKGLTKALSFAQKRSIVAELTALGVTGKGAMTKAIAKAGLTQGVSGLAARGFASSALQGGVAGVFANQVATGKGLIGAGASIGALGGMAVAATAGIATLVGALGWVAYKTWQIKQAKDAVLEDVESNKKYRYKSLQDLYDQLEKTRKKAEETKSAVDNVKGDTPLKEESGQSVGWFTGRWWKALGSSLATLGLHSPPIPEYTFQQARMDNLTQSIETYAEKNVQRNLEAAIGELGKLSDPLKVMAFMRNIPGKYYLDDKLVDSTLMTKRWDGSMKYVQNGRNMTVEQAQRTAPYINYYNENLVQPLQTIASTYRDAIWSSEGAQKLIARAGFDFSMLDKRGFYQDKDGQWVQRELKKGAKSDEIITAYSDFEEVRSALVDVVTRLRKDLGDSPTLVTNVMEKAGFSPSLYSNEPLSDESDPTKRNGIKGVGLDDGGAGGNYSGTGKLSSVAPKQVIVNISNLMSIETIDLLKGPEGQAAEIQNVKDLLAQALIDTVHDFDASWNG